MSDNFYNFPLWILALISIISDFGDHLMAIHSTVAMLLWNKDILSKLKIIGNHKSKIFILLEGTHNFGDSPL